MRTIGALSAIIALVWIPPGTAQPSTYITTNAVGPAACLTVDAYHQYLSASLYARETRDVSRMKSLYGSGQCFRMKKGVKATLVEAGLTVSQIRLYAPTGESALVWTASENIARPSSIPSWAQSFPSFHDILMTASRMWIGLVIVAIVAVFLYSILRFRGSNVRSARVHRRHTPWQKL